MVHLLSKALLLTLTANALPTANRNLLDILPRHISVWEALARSSYSSLHPATIEVSLPRKVARDIDTETTENIYGHRMRHKPKSGKDFSGSDGIGLDDLIPGGDIGDSRDKKHGKDKKKHGKHHKEEDAHRFLMGKDKFGDMKDVAAGTGNGKGKWGDKEEKAWKKKIEEEKEKIGDKVWSGMGKGFWEMLKKWLKKLVGMEEDIGSENTRDANQGD